MIAFVQALALPLLLGALSCGCTSPAQDHEPDGCYPAEAARWPWQTTAQRGLWGEDPRFVPTFAFRQEARAPKMPKADEYLKLLGDRQITSLSDGLLICQVETYTRDGTIAGTVLAPYNYKLEEPNARRPRCSRDWDPLNAPDTLLRFR